MVEHKPIGFSDCVAFGRAMFEEFFRNNALQLLDAFPLDHKASDGSESPPTPSHPPLSLSLLFSSVQH